MENESDQDLVGAAVSGDAAAFARLIERHYEKIYRTAYKWCGHQADAEDIAQEVCVKLGGAIKSFRADAAFSSWLFRVTLNVVRDFQRAKKRRSENISALALVAEADYRPDPVGDMTKDQMWEKIRRLSPKQRDAMLLVFAEGLSHGEAAEVMKCAESTVSWHIHEAKKHLKQEMQS